MPFVTPIVCLAVVVAAAAATPPRGHSPRAAGQAARDAEGLPAPVARPAVQKSARAPADPAAKRNYSVPAAEAAEGFVSLFDGRSLRGWQGATDSYEVSHGVLGSKPEEAGNLFTRKQYADFVLRFEFKLAAGGNNGIGIRAPLAGRTSREGMEIQIIDDTAEKWAHLKDYQYHGAIYRLVPAKPGSLKPVGQWNTMEIDCRGPRVKVTCNGKLIVDADLAQLGPLGLDGEPQPGHRRKRGYIGLLGHRSRVEFRHLRIKDLSAKAQAA